MGCNFCGKVGRHPISNDRTNFSCLKVKKKKENPKNDDQQVFKI
jgi:hypothetical protein